MIQIKEALINSVRPLKNKSLAVTLWIKAEDINEIDRKQLEDYWTSETPLVAVLQEFDWIKEEDPKPKLRQRLAIIIKIYCEKFNTSEEEELKNIYSKFWIESRKDLTEKQLKELIDSYELWLTYN